MATTQYKDNAGNIYEFQQEAGDAGGAERRPVAGMPAAVRTQLSEMAASLSNLASAVLGGVLKVVLQTGTAVIGKLGPNPGVNIGTVDVASGTLTMSGSIPAGTNNIGDVDIASMPPLPAGTSNIGDVDVLTLPSLPQLPTTLGQKTKAGSLGVTLASDQGNLAVTVATALPAGTANIGDVDVLTLPSLPAGSNNIGDVDVLTLPAIGQLPASLGAKLSTASLSVALASDQVAIPVNDAGGSITVDGAVTIGGSLPAGTNNIGDVDVLTLPPLPAGTSNIGDVDVLTLPAIGQLPTTLGAKPSAGSLSVALASDQVAVPINDGGGSLTVDGAVAISAALPAGTNNIGDVDVLTLPALPAGTNNIGDVDVLTLPALPQLPASLGQKVMASSTSFAIASDQSAVATKTEAFADYDTAAGTQNVSLRGIALPASGGAVAGGTSTAPLRVDPTGTTVQPVSGSVTVASMAALPAGTNNIGDVDIASMPALPAGSNAIGKLAANVGVNIGTVDMNNALQLPPALGQRTKATSLGVTIASDQSPVVVVDGGSPILVQGASYGQPLPVSGTVNVGNSLVVNLGTSLPAGNANIGDVDIASMPALPAGNNNIGDVDVATLPALPQLPASLGAKATAASLAVTLPTDQAPLSILDSAPLTSTVTTVTASDVAITLVAANLNRVGLLIVNDEAAVDPLLVKLGSGVTTSSWSVKIQPGGYWEMPRRYYSGVVTGIWATSTLREADDDADADSEVEPRAVVPGSAHVTETG